jgi:hypothetical protein
VRPFGVGLVCGDAPSTNTEEFPMTTEFRFPGSDGPSDTISTTETAGCCSAQKQATCCDSGEKSTCCGSDATAGGGCGCQ